MSRLAPGTRRQSAVLQRVLAAEHAVVYGYGVAGARLEGQLAGLGVSPVPPAASYALPTPVTTAEEARTLVTLLEERLAAVWADAVADLAHPADRDLRGEAAGGLAEAAVAAARWRGGSVPFPGLPERAG